MEKVNMIGFIPMQRRFPTQALAVALLLAVPAMGIAQQAPADLNAGDVNAPVISAPSAPMRLIPSADAPMPDDGFVGVNNFAATDLPPPALDALPPVTPVVVELFTSQGCSSCPPADAMMAKLADQDGVLPLSFHVDYWDYLGWADSFARPEFSARQEAYARAAGERSVYTPQLIVEGVDTAVSPGPAQLMGLIEAHQMSPALLNVQRRKQDGSDLIELMPLSDLEGQVDVSLIRFLPERRVEVRGGENDGRFITYTNIVLGMETLAKWDGSAPLRLNVRAGQAGDGSFPDDTRHVILVQIGLAGSELPGAILAAIELD